MIKRLESFEENKPDQEMLKKIKKGLDNKNKPYTENELNHQPKHKSFRRLF